MTRPRRLRRLLWLIVSFAALAASALCGVGDVLLHPGAWVTWAGQACWGGVVYGWSWACWGWAWVKGAAEVVSTAVGIRQGVKWWRGPEKQGA